MTTLLLPELARENAASNRRVARSVDTAASQPRVTHSAREALRYSLGQAALARGHWQDVLALFEDGVEGGEAREAVHAVLDFFDSWFDLARSTRALWQAAGAPGAAPEGLDAATREVEALRRNAEEMRAFLDFTGGRVQSFRRRTGCPGRLPQGPG